MDNLNHHDYLQGEMGFDDLMSSGGWPGAGPANSNNHQFGYQQQTSTTSPQEQYQQYNAQPHQQQQQPSYHQFDLPRASYPQVQIPYSTSPYTSQYQHATSPDAFVPSSFLDPSMGSTASYPGADATFPYESQAAEHPTISPQSLYHMGGTQGMNRAISNSPFQQSAVSASSHNFSQNNPNPQNVYYDDFQHTNMQRSSVTQVQYPTLPTGLVGSVSLSEAAPSTSTIEQSEETPNGFYKAPPEKTPQEKTTQDKVPQEKVQPPKSLLRITHPDLLASKDAAYSLPLLHAPFLALGNKPIQVQLGGKTTIPKFHPRKARSGRELVPGFDISQASTPRTPGKRGRPRKDRSETGAPSYKGTSKASKPVSDKLTALREDGNPQSPTPTETSSSEYESSSDDDQSDYEEELPVIDISTVREMERPIDPVLAARWDALGAVWKDTNRIPSDEAIKEAIPQFGNLISNLRLQIKANATKVDAAAKQPEELAALKAHRKILFDSFFETVDAAVTQGCVHIVKYLGADLKLFNGLTATLIDCIKVEDYNGKLPKAILGLINKFEKVTEEQLKKMKFDAAHKRLSKKGDAEIKEKLASIMSNTVEAKERAEVAAKEDKKKADEKKREEFQAARKRVQETAMKTATANSTKRPHDGDGSNGKPAKKLATDGLSGTSGAVKPAQPRKLGNLLGIASKPAPKPVRKSEPSAPVESKLNAILTSINRPAEAPKQPAPPPRAPETDEEKARRLRKESRRHLRVKFKEGDELEQIRLFKHEQGEDEGRQDDMLRDANDSHNEGMMHKQRVFEADEVADEDEYTPPDFIEPIYTEPINIDFSPLNKSTKFGPVYTSRGGDLKFATPEQKTQERREAVELMVIYTDPADIPPTPKEPVQVDSSAGSKPEIELKQPTEPWLTQRLQEINYFGPEKASQIFVRRQQEIQAARDSRLPGSDQPSQPPLPQVYPQPKSAMEERADYDNLARIIANIKSLMGKPFPPTEPPEWMTDASQRQIWIDGYNRDAAIKQAAAQQAPTTMYQPPPAVAPPPPAPQAANYQYQAPVTAAASQQFYGYDFNQMQSAFTGHGNNDTNAQASQDFAWGDANTTINPNQGKGQRQRNDDNWSNDMYSNKPNNRSQGGGKNKRKHDDGPFDDNGTGSHKSGKKQKQKPCHFFQDGNCHKGDLCTYSHDL